MMTVPLLSLLACTAPELGMIPGASPLWDPEALPVFEITVPQDDWLDVLWADAEATGQCGDNVYQRASVRFHNPATGEVEAFEDVGLRLRGNASLEAARDGGEQPGLKLSFSEFEEDRDLHGTEKFALLGTEGDFTYVREHLALSIAREAGLPAPNNAFSLVYVNGAFHGLMPYTEEPDDRRYVENHFLGVDGSLYKASGYCGTGTSSDLTWVSDDIDDYIYDYVPKAGTDEAAVADDLIPMLDCATNTTDEQFSACVQDWVDLDGLLTLIALDQLLPDVDGLVGPSHNYMMFFDQGWDRFYFYPWDKDQSFYDHELAPGSTPMDMVLVYDDEKKPLLVSRVQRVFHEEYCDALRGMHARLDPAVLTPRVESLGQFLWYAVDADPRYDMVDWKYGVQALIDKNHDRWWVDEDALEAACGAR